MGRLKAAPTSEGVPPRVMDKNDPEALTASVIKALANERRLEILNWLKSPTAHFPAQRDGDLVKDGVCGLFIAQKLGVSQPTASEHLRILSHAGLIRGKRIKQWTFYKRDEKRISMIKRAFRIVW
jgi:DNA-binding transcriptional ArsR family regulator